MYKTLSRDCFFSQIKIHWQKFHFCLLMQLHFIDNSENQSKQSCSDLRRPWCKVGPLSPFYGTIALIVQYYEAGFFYYEPYCIKSLRKERGKKNKLTFLTTKINKEEKSRNLWFFSRLYCCLLPSPWFLNNNKYFCLFRLFAI